MRARARVKVRIGVSDKRGASEKNIGRSVGRTASVLDRPAEQGKGWWPRVKVSHVVPRLWIELAWLGSGLRVGSGVGPG